MRYAVLVALCVLLVGCGDAFDEISCRNRVAADFNTQDVTNLGHSSFHFIVRAPDGSVWLADCMSIHGPEVTSKTQIFPPRK